MARLALLLALLAVAGTATAEEEVISALSQNRVSITANFDGSEIFVVGAVKREEPIPEDSDLDIIVTVAGPQQPVIVRKKERRLGVWVNTQSVEVEQVPSFYAVASTRSLKNILSEAEDDRYRISVERVLGPAAEQLTAAGSDQFVEAIIRIRQVDGLYTVAPGTISLAEDTLFGTHIALPANLVEGDYRVRSLLIRDGQVVDTNNSAIFVRKVGLGRLIYHYANEQPLLYGIFAVILAIATGWVASAAFRRFS